MRVLRSLLPAAFAATAALAAAETPSQPATEANETTAVPKKADAKKAASSTKKKSPRKKNEPTKAAPAKPEHVAPGVTRYSNARDVPVLRDSYGNVIPTSPDAYDVSSATGGKKK